MSGEFDRVNNDGVDTTSTDAQHWQYAFSSIVHGHIDTLVNRGISIPKGNQSRQEALRLKLLVETWQNEGCRGRAPQTKYGIASFENGKVYVAIIHDYGYTFIASNRPNGVHKPISRPEFFICCSLVQSIMDSLL